MKRMPVVKVPRPCDCEAWPFCEHQQALNSNRKPTPHTPGPWHTQNCKVLDSYAVSEVADCEFVQLSIYQAQANARLISAAPELLEACVAMLKDNHELGELSRPVANQARAAIHKAGEDYHR